MKPIAPAILIVLAALVTVPLASAHNHPPIEQSTPAGTLRIEAFHIITQQGNTCHYERVTFNGLVHIDETFLVGGNPCPIP